MLQWHLNNIDYCQSSKNINYCHFLRYNNYDYCQWSGLNLLLWFRSLKMNHNLIINLNKYPVLLLFFWFILLYNYILTFGKQTNLLIFMSDREGVSYFLPPKIVCGDIYMNKCINTKWTFGKQVNLLIFMSDAHKFFIPPKMA